MNYILISPPFTLKPIPYVDILFINIKIFIMLLYNDIDYKRSNCDENHVKNHIIHMEFSLHIINRSNLSLF